MQQQSPGVSSSCQGRSFPPSGLEGCSGQVSELNPQGPCGRGDRVLPFFSAVSFHLRITAAVYVADSVLSVQHALSHPVTALPSGVGTIIILSLHVRQLRLRDIKSSAYGHTARKWPGN